MNWLAEQQRGCFLFSVDTELAWGFFDHFDPGAFTAARERETINRLLDILDEFNITATWAVVGGMFEERYQGSALGSPVTNWLRQYPDFYDLVTNGSPLLYGPDIIDLLPNRGARHEIGFHGFTHRLFNERTMSEREARAEIELWLSVAGKHNIIPRSVTFPRSRVGFLDLFQEYGFLCYRDDSMRVKGSTLPLIGRAFRRWPKSMSAVVGVPIHEATRSPGGLACLLASQSLFGFNQHLERLLDGVGVPNLRLLTLARAIRQAGVRKKAIHLVVHPYEFRTGLDFEKLRFVLRQVAVEVERGTLRSVAMADVAQAVLGEG